MPRPRKEADIIVATPFENLRDARRLIARANELLDLACQSVDLETGSKINNLALANTSTSNALREVQKALVELD